VATLAAVRARDDTQQAPRADEEFRVQPHLFGSALVLAGMDISVDKSGCVLVLVFGSFQARKCTNQNHRVDVTATSLYQRWAQGSQREYTQLHIAASGPLKVICYYSL